MIIPPYLKKGDTVALVAPARKVNKEDILPQIEALESWGLKVVHGPHTFGSLHQLSGTDAERAEDFNLMLADEEVKALICLRGGYGSVRMIDMVDFTLIKKTPKWVVGFSDITLFLNEINNLGIAALHGPMPLVFPKVDSISLESLRKTLFGEHKDILFPNSPNNRVGKVQGELVGGNLSIVVSNIGTKSEVDTDGKILFIEDLDEYYYHLDRMFHQLKRAGKLAKIKALIIGSMNDIKDNPIPFGYSIYDIVNHLVADMSFPVVFDFPSGHESLNYSLVMGANYELQVGERCYLKYLN